MQEFDKHDIETTVQFEADEAERQRQTPGLGAPDTATTSRPSTELEKQREESDDEESGIVGNDRFGSLDSGSKSDRTGSMSQQFLP